MGSLLSRVYRPRSCSDASRKVRTHLAHTHTHTARHTHSQTDRGTDRGRDRQTDGQTDTQTGKTVRETGKQSPQCCSITHTHTHSPPHTHTTIILHTHTDKQTGTCCFWFPPWPCRPPPPPCSSSSTPAGQAPPPPRTGRGNRRCPRPPPHLWCLTVMTGSACCFSWSKSLWWSCVCLKEGVCVWRVCMCGDGVYGGCCVCVCGCACASICVYVSAIVCACV